MFVGVILGGIIVVGLITQVYFIVKAIFSKGEK